MAIAFALGAVFTIPVVFFERWAFEQLLVSGSMSWWRVAVLALVVIALCEELVKFLILRFAAYPQTFFNEPFDGIVYAVLIAMGFATAENIVYADRFGLNTVLLRSMTAVPAHLMFAIIQGYYAGLARFNPQRSGYLLLKGLLLAVVLHGAYDLLVLQEKAQWLFVLATASIYLGLYYTTKMIREHQDNSPFR
ncbi:MAG: PrsW family intramembrane metalloprotease [Lewinellaceae bacterium]|nr:PrsW family intramembrane metalloprotease [Lewinellaceae bacterium]